MMMPKITAMHVPRSRKKNERKASLDRMTHAAVINSRKSSENDFVIDENGVLTKYTGHDTEIILPDTVKIIGEEVFGYREGYLSAEKITVPEGVTEIRDSAFSMSRLKEIHLPSSLKTIGKCVFSHCRELRSITIPDGITEIKHGTFIYCYQLEEVNLPEHITKIGESAFWDCKPLKKINLPESDRLEIGPNAFHNCISLVDDSGFLILQNRLFAFHKDDDGSLVEADIPDTVTSIENGVFNNYTWINITMSVNCPFWEVSEKRMAFPKAIIKHSGCSLSFRDEKGKIIAKAVLETNGENEHTENDCMRFLRCKKSGGFDFEAYDSMFYKLKQEYNRLKIALLRLRYPYELSEEMKETYVSYLLDHRSIAGRIVINDGDHETLSVLIQKRILNTAVFPELIEYAQMIKRYECVALLLDHQNTEFDREDVSEFLKLNDDDED